MSEPAITYGSYLKIDELLALQQPRSPGPEHDEMLFILIHQVYELWFKELLHELDHACTLLIAGETIGVQHTFTRLLSILRVIGDQVTVLETMTPQGFLSFRKRLEAASGFQSDQFRQIEFTLGLKSPQAIDRCPHNTRAHAALTKRLTAPTLWDAFLRFLADRGHSVPASVLQRDVTRPVEPSSEVQDILLDIYRHHSIAAELCERLIDIDELLQEWRYRHLKMVERTIGARAGTGGTTSGSGYLAATIARQAFPDLWAIRSQL